MSKAPNRPIPDARAIMARSAAWQNVEVVDLGGDGPCWIWAGWKDPKGYGRINAPGASLLVHRVAYAAERGDIPDGLQVDHLCRQRACINPAHLEAVTAAENLRRMHKANPSIVIALNAAPRIPKVECIRGHKLSGENVYLRNGVRHCKACGAIRGQRRTLALRSAAI